MAELETSTDYTATAVRVTAAPEERLFCVTTRAPMEKLDVELDRMIPLLEAAQREAGAVGPVMIRYFETDTKGLWRMDVGVRLTGREDVQPAGEAQIVTLPEIRCGSLLHWGSLAHIGESYGALKEGISAAGLASVGEGREWYLHFTGDTSPDNVILLQLEVRTDDGE